MATRYYRDGLTQREVAAEFGVHNSTVSRRIAHLKPPTDSESFLLGGEVETRGDSERSGHVSIGTAESDRAARGQS
ncbi:transposase family protein [Streptomyces kanamyceticus]